MLCEDKLDWMPASSEGEADGGQAPGSLHHVIVRGIEKRRIVDDDKDIKWELLLALAPLDFRLHETFFLPIFAQSSFR